MVTCKSDNQIVAIPKMNSVRTRKTNGSNSSGTRLLESDHQETSSSVSRNSVYKLKIDLMFDDTRYVFIFCFHFIYLPIRRNYLYLNTSSFCISKLIMKSGVYMETMLVNLLCLFITIVLLPCKYLSLSLSCVSNFI